jgi:hypothetical protein
MSLDTILPLVLFFGFILLIVTLAVGINILSARRFAEASARLEQQSMERGWQYHSFREGSTATHNISGKTDHVSWQIESHKHTSTSGRSSNTVRYTRWWTEDVSLSGEVVLILPKEMGSAFQAFNQAKAPGSAPGGLAGLASSFIQMVLRHLVTEILNAAPDDAAVFENIQLVQAGSESLRQHYTILATSELTASRFLDEDAERMLLSLVATPGSAQQMRTMAVVYWHRGIQFIVSQQIDDIDKLEQLVRLGVALVSGQKASAWS